MTTRTYEPDGHVSRNGHGSETGELYGGLVNSSGSLFPCLAATRRITLGGVLLALASLLLAALAVTQGWVSWAAQVTFFEHAGKPVTPSLLEALGLDAAMVTMSVTALALARLGRPARIERALIVAASAGSLAMNLGGANLGSPRSVIAYALPPVLFAVTADRLVAVVRRSALGPAGHDAASPVWSIAGTAALYTARWVVAPKSTTSGARRALLNATPLPAADEPLQLPAGDQAPAPGRHRPPEDTTEMPSGEGRSKKQQLIDAFDALPASDRTVSDIAKHLGPQCGLEWSQARTILYRHVNGRER